MKHASRTRLRLAAAVLTSLALFAGLADTEAEPRGKGVRIPAFLRAAADERSTAYWLRGKLWASSIMKCGPSDCVGQVGQGSRRFREPKRVEYPARAEVIVRLQGRPVDVKVRSWLDPKQNRGRQRQHSISPTRNGSGWVVRIIGRPEKMRYLRLYAFFSSGSWGRWSFATAPRR